MGKGALCWENSSSVFGESYRYVNVKTGAVLARVWWRAVPGTAYHITTNNSGYWRGEFYATGETVTADYLDLAQRLIEGMAVEEALEQVADD
jgi:hypothetical protein